MGSCTSNALQPPPAYSQEPPPVAYPSKSVTPPTELLQTEYTLPKSNTTQGNSVIESLVVGHFTIEFATHYDTDKKDIAQITLDKFKIEWAIKDDVLIKNMVLTIDGQKITLRKIPVWELIYKGSKISWRIYAPNNCNEFCIPGANITNTTLLKKADGDIDNSLCTYLEKFMHRFIRDFFCIRDLDENGKSRKCVPTSVSLKHGTFTRKEDVVLNTPSNGFFLKVNYFEITFILPDNTIYIYSFRDLGSTHYTHSHYTHFLETNGQQPLLYTTNNKIIYLEFGSGCYLLKLCQINHESKLLIWKQVTTGEK